MADNGSECFEIDRIFNVDQLYSQHGIILRQILGAAETEEQNVEKYIGFCHKLSCRISETGLPDFSSQIGCKPDLERALKCIRNILEEWENFQDYFSQDHLLQIQRKEAGLPVNISQEICQPRNVYNSAFSKCNIPESGIQFKAETWNLKEFLNVVGAYEKLKSRIDFSGRLYQAKTKKILNFENRVFNAEMALEVANKKAVDRKSQEEQYQSDLERISSYYDDLLILETDVISLRGKMINSMHSKVQPSMDISEREIGKACSAQRCYEERYIKFWDGYVLRDPISFVELYLDVRRALEISVEDHAERINEVFKELKRQEDTHLGTAEPILKSWNLFIKEFHAEGTLEIISKIPLKSIEKQSKEILDRYRIWKKNSKTILTNLECTTVEIVKATNNSYLGYLFQGNTALVIDTKNKANIYDRELSKWKGRSTSFEELLNEACDIQHELAKGLDTLVTLIVYFESGETRFRELFELSELMSARLKYCLNLEQIYLYILDRRRIKVGSMEIYFNCLRDAKSGSSELTADVEENTNALKFRSRNLLANVNLAKLCVGAYYILLKSMRENRVNAVIQEGLDKLTPAGLAKLSKERKIEENLDDLQRFIVDCTRNLQELNRKNQEYAEKMKVEQAKIDTDFIKLQAADLYVHESKNLNVELLIYQGHNKNTVERLEFAIRETSEGFISKFSDIPEIDNDLYCSCVYVVKDHPDKLPNFRDTYYCHLFSLKQTECDQCLKLSKNTVMRFDELLAYSCSLVEEFESLDAASNNRRTSEITNAELHAALKSVIRIHQTETYINILQGKYIELQKFQRRLREIEPLQQKVTKSVGELTDSISTTMSFTRKRHDTFVILAQHTQKLLEHETSCLKDRHFSKVLEAAVIVNTLVLQIENNDTLERFMDVAELGEFEFWLDTNEETLNKYLKVFTSGIALLHEIAQNEFEEREKKVKAICSVADLDYIDEWKLKTLEEIEDFSTFLKTLTQQSKQFEQEFKNGWTSLDELLTSCDEDMKAILSQPFLFIRRLFNDHLMHTETLLASLLDGANQLSEIQSMTASSEVQCKEIMRVFQLMPQWRLKDWTDKRAKIESLTKQAAKGLRDLQSLRDRLNDVRQDSGSDSEPESGSFSQSPDMPNPEKPGSDKPSTDNPSSDMRSLLFKQSYDKLSLHLSSPDDPRADKPNTDEHITHETNTDEPNTSEPNTDQPNTNESNTNEPHTDQPNTNEPNTNEPHTHQPNTNEPNTNEPHTHQPNTNEPNTNEPHTHQPNTNEPNTNEPHTHQPNTNEPNTNEPHTHQPNTNELNTNEPHTHQPNTNEPKTDKLYTNEQNTDQPITEQPTKNEPNINEPHTDQSNNNDPNTDKSNTNEPSTDEPDTDQSNTTEPSTNESDTDQSNTNEPSTDEPDTDQSNTNEPSTNEPHTDQSNTTEPSTNESDTDQSNTNKPSTDEPDTDQSNTNEPSTNEPNIGQSNTNEPSTDEPDNDQSNTNEPSTNELNTDQPNNNEANTDQPNTNEPKNNETNIDQTNTNEPYTNETNTNQSNTNEPSINEPKTDQLNTNEPNTDQPNSNEANTDQPNTNEPNTNESITDQPYTNEPNTVQPIPNEPNTTEPNANEPKTDQPITNEPNTIVPKIDQSNTNEPNNNEPNTNEPNTNVTNTNEPNADQPITNQPNTNEPNTDQSNNIESNTNKPNTDQPITNEPNTNEPNTDQPIPNEPNTNEPQTDQSNTIEPKANEQNIDQLLLLLLLPLLLLLFVLINYYNYYYY